MDAPPAPFVFDLGEEAGLLFVTPRAAAALRDFSAASRLGAWLPDDLRAAAAASASGDRGAPTVDGAALARLVREHLVGIAAPPADASLVLETLVQLLEVLRYPGSDGAPPCCAPEDLCMALLPAMGLRKSAALGHAWGLAAAAGPECAAPPDDDDGGGGHPAPLRLTRRGVWRMLRALLALLLVACDEPGDSAGEREGLGVRAQRLARVASAAAVEGTAALFAAAGAPPGGVSVGDLAAVYNSRPDAALGWLELLNAGKWVPVLLPAAPGTPDRGAPAPADAAAPSTPSPAAAPPPAVLQLLLAVDPPPSGVVVRYPLRGGARADAAPSIGGDAGGAPLRLCLTASACHVMAWLATPPSGAAAEAPLPDAASLLATVARGLAAATPGDGGELHGGVGLPEFLRAAQAVRPARCAVDNGDAAASVVWRALLHRTHALLEAGGGAGAPSLAAAAALSTLAPGTKSQKLSALFQAFGAPLPRATPAASPRGGSARSGLTPLQLGAVFAGVHAALVALQSLGAEADFLSSPSGERPASVTVAPTAQLGAAVAAESAMCGRDTHAAIAAHAAAGGGVGGGGGGSAPPLVTFEQLTRWYNDARAHHAPPSPALELVAAARLAALPGVGDDAAGGPARVGALARSLSAHDDVPAAALRGGGDVPVLWAVGGPHVGGGVGAAHAPSPPSTPAVNTAGAVGDPTGGGGAGVDGGEDDVVFGFELPGGGSGGEPAVMRVRRRHVRAFHHVRAATGLASVSLDAVVDALADAADAAGRVTRHAVGALPLALRALAGEDKENAPPPGAAAQGALEAAFDLCDPTGAGTAAVADVASALAVACACPSASRGKSGKLAGLWRLWRRRGGPIPLSDDGDSGELGCGLALDQRGLASALQGILRGLLVFADVDGVSPRDARGAAGVAQRASEAAAGVAFCQPSAVVRSPARASPFRSPPPPLLPFGAFAELYADGGPLSEVIAYIELLDETKWPAEHTLPPLSHARHEVPPPPLRGGSPRRGGSPVGTPATTPSGRVRNPLAPIADVPAQPPASAADGAAGAMGGDTAGDGGPDDAAADVLFVAPLCGSPLGGALPPVEVSSGDIAGLRRLLRSPTAGAGLASADPASLLPLLAAHAGGARDLPGADFLHACRSALLPQGAPEGDPVWAELAVQLGALHGVVAALGGGVARADALAAALAAVCPRAGKSEKLRAAWRGFVAPGVGASGSGALPLTEARLLLASLLAGVVCLVAPSGWLDDATARPAWVAGVLDAACGDTLHAACAQLPPGSRVSLEGVSAFYNEGGEALSWLELLKLPAMALADAPQQPGALPPPPPLPATPPPQQQQQPLPPLTPAGGRHAHGSPLGSPAPPPPPGRVGAGAPARQPLSPLAARAQLVDVCFPPGHPRGGPAAVAMTLTPDGLGAVAAVAGQVGLASLSPRAVLSVVRSTAAAAGGALVDVPAFGAIVRALVSRTGGEARLSPAAQGFLTRALGGLFFVLADVEAAGGAPPPPHGGGSDPAVSARLVGAALVALSGGSAASRWACIFTDAAPPAAGGAEDGLATALSAVLGAYVALAGCGDPAGGGGGAAGAEVASAAAVVDVARAWAAAAAAAGAAVDAPAVVPWLEPLLTPPPTALSPRGAPGSGSPPPLAAAAATPAEGGEHDKENRPPPPPAVAGEGGPAGGPGAPVFAFVGPSGRPSVALTLRGCARLLSVARASGLSRVAPRDVCLRVAAAGDPRGALSRRGFQRLAAGWAAGAPVDASVDAAGADADVAVLGSVFTAVAAGAGAGGDAQGPAADDPAATAPARRVAVGVLVLAGGSKSEKLQAAFSLYGGGPGAPPLRQDDVGELLGCLLTALAAVEAHPAPLAAGRRASIRRHARALAAAMGDVTLEGLGGWYDANVRAAAAAASVQGGPGTGGGGAEFLELLSLAKLAALVEGGA